MPEVRVLEWLEHDSDGQQVTDWIPAIISENYFKFNHDHWTVRKARLGLLKSSRGCKSEI